MPMQWNEQADAKLFANVIKIHVAKLDYQALAKAMGENVTPKAISHRISKIKEKAQVRRFDWELYSNPPTPCIQRKRGPKKKIVEDDDDTKKRVKVEDPTIKIEESQGVGTDYSPDGTGQHYWANGWPPVVDPGQQFYGLYRMDDSRADMVDNGDGARENAGPAPVGVGCVGNDDESVGLSPVGTRNENGACGNSEADYATEIVPHENLVV